MARIDSFFYKPIERTQEEAKQICLGNLDTELILLESGWKFNQTDDEVKLRCEVLKRQIRRVENDLCQRAVWNKQSTFSFYENNIFYEDLDEYRNTIRIDDIDSFFGKTLKSFQECVEFVSCHSPPDEFGIQFAFVNSEKLIEFWQKYPNGLIKFQ